MPRAPRPGYRQRPIPDSKPEGRAILVLAAGRGRRFGSDKRRARLNNNETVLSASIGRYALLGWPVYIVLRNSEQALVAHTEQALRRANVATRPQWLRAPDADQGMGHSLAAGVTALADAGISQGLIGLGDMPYVLPATIQACANALEAQHGLHTDAIVRPRYLGQPGNPVGFAGTRLLELRKARDDTGARPMLQAHAASIHWLDVDDPGILSDIDAPDDILPELPR